MHLKEIDILARIRITDTTIDEAFVAIRPDQADQFVAPFRRNMGVPVPGIEPKEVRVVFLNQFLYLRKGFPLPILLEILVSPPGIPIGQGAVRIFPILPV